MKRNDYIAPAIIKVDMETEQPIAGSLSDDGNKGSFGGTTNKGDAGSALVGDKRYFDSWSDDAE